MNILEPMHDINAAVTVQINRGTHKRKLNCLRKYQVHNRVQIKGGSLRGIDEKMDLLL